jgi:hypothetical protein
MSSAERYAARSKLRGPAYADKAATAASGFTDPCSMRRGAIWRACKYTLRGAAARLTGADFDRADLTAALRLTGTLRRACDASCAASGRASDVRRGATSPSMAQAAQTGSSSGAPATIVGKAGLTSGVARPNRPRSQWRNRWRTFMVRNSLRPPSYSLSHPSCPRLPSG